MSTARCLRKQSDCFLVTERAQQATHASRRLGTIYKIIQAISIEYPEECLERLLERPSQPAGGADYAYVALLIEAFDQSKTILCRAYDRSQIDRLGSASESQPAMPPSNALDKSSPYQRLGDLHQVAVGDVVAAGNVLNGVQRLRFEREEHEHPQSMVSVNREAHICDWRAGSRDGGSPSRQGVQSRAHNPDPLEGILARAWRQPQPLVTL